MQVARCAFSAPVVVHSMIFGIRPRQRTDRVQVLRFSLARSFPRRGRAPTAATGTACHARKRATANACRRISGHAMQ